MTRIRRLLMVGIALGARVSMAGAMAIQADPAQVVVGQAFTVTVTEPGPVTSVSIALLDGPGLALCGNAALTISPSGGSKFAGLTIAGKVGASPLTVTLAAVGRVPNSPVLVPAACALTVRPASGGQPARLRFVAQPLPAGAGQPLTPVGVEALDAAGARVASDQWHIRLDLPPALSAAARLSGTVQVVAKQGLATFSDLSLDRIMAGFELVASLVETVVPAVAPVYSAPFDVAASGPARAAAAFLATAASLQGDGRVLPADGQNRGVELSSRSQLKLHFDSLLTSHYGTAVPQLEPRLATVRQQQGLLADMRQVLGEYQGLEMKRGLQAARYRALGIQPFTRSQDSVNGALCGPNVVVADVETTFHVVLNNHAGVSTVTATQFKAGTATALPQVGPLSVDTTIKWTPDAAGDYVLTATATEKQPPIGGGHVTTWRLPVRVVAAGTQRLSIDGIWRDDLAAAPPGYPFAHLRHMDWLADVGEKDHGRGTPVAYKVGDALCHVLIATSGDMPSSVDVTLDDKILGSKNVDSKTGCFDLSPDDFKGDEKLLHDLVISSNGIKSPPLTVVNRAAYKAASDASDHARQEFRAKLDTAHDALVQAMAGDPALAASLAEERQALEDGAYRTISDRLATKLDAVRKDLAAQAAGTSQLWVEATVTDSRGRQHAVAVPNYGTGGARNEGPHPLIDDRVRQELNVAEAIKTTVFTKGQATLDQAKTDLHSAGLLLGQCANAINSELLTEMGKLVADLRNADKTGLADDTAAVLQDLTSVRDLVTGAAAATNAAGASEANQLFALASSLSVSLSHLAATIKKAMVDVDALVPKLRIALDNLPTTANDLKEKLTGPVRQTLTALEGLQTVQDLRKLADLLMVEASTNDALVNLTPKTIADGTNLDTQVNLGELDPAWFEPGGQYKLTATVRPWGAAPTDAGTDQVAWTLGVYPTSGYWRANGALLFASRCGASSKGTLKTATWDPALGVAVHYYPSWRWCRSLGLGVGASASLLDFDTEASTEYGLAGSLSLFHSKLLGGGGYNITAQTAYVYFGANVLELFSIGR